MQTIKESWDYIEANFSKAEFDESPEILNLMKALRANGFDEKLVAGQSISNLRLYRKNTEGYRHDGLVLHFEFWEYLQLKQQKKEFENGNFAEFPQLQHHLEGFLRKRDTGKVRVLLIKDEFTKEMWTEVKYSQEIESLLAELLLTEID